MDAAPDLTISKSDGGVTAVPGGTIAYTLSYSNVGNQGAAGVLIGETVPADTTFNAGASTAGWSCANGSAAGTACTFTVGGLTAGGIGSVTFAVTVVNPVAAGVVQISNTATIADDGTNGSDPTPGNNLGSDATPVTTSPHLILTKVGVLDMTVSGSVYVADIGDVINYTLEATNDGNVVLSGVTISDLKVGALSCTPAQPSALAPTEKLTCTGSYTLVQADLDAHKVDNTGSVDSDQTSPVGTSNTVSLPDLSLIKTATPHLSSPAQTGDLIDYEIVATNNGEVALKSVAISDPLLGALSCTPAQPAALALTEELTCTGSYTITQADIDAGKVDNIANVVSKLADDITDGPQKTSNQHVVLQQGPGVHIGKTSALDMTKAGPAGRADVGDVINYTFSVENRGNVTLHDITVSDPNVTVITCPSGNPIPTLTVGAIETCTGSYTITQTDIDAGNMHNTATASGKDPSDNPVDDTGSNDQPLAGSAQLTIVKSANPLTYSTAGAVISYSYEVTNSGNITLIGPFTVSDDKTTDESCPATATLAPGAGITCASSYTITQADLDAGSVTNIASASNMIVTSLADTKTVAAIQSPAISVLKSSTTTAITSAGQVVPYTFAVANTGNVTLSGITVTDSKCDGAPVYQSGDDNTDGKLQLTETWVYTCSHTATQAEVDAGGTFSNTVTADSTESAPGTSTMNIPVTKTADLSISKTDGAVVAVPGQGFIYTIVVTNNGPSSVSGATVADTLPGALTGVTWTCSASAGSSCTASGIGSINDSVDLLSGGAATYTVAATVSAAATGNLVNTATVTVPGGTTDPVPGNNSATDTDVLTPQSDLSITKTSSPEPYVAGGAFTYTIVVNNAGPSNAVGARVQDALPAALGSFTWNCVASGAGASCGTGSGSGDIDALVTLPVGTSATFTVSGTVPAGTTGALVNTATVAEPAGTTDPVPGNNSSSDTNPTGPIADLSITKTSGPDPYVPGAAFTYTIVVDNAGPDGAVGARVQDALPGALGSFTWNCVASGAGASCGTGSGSGDIDALVTLPVGTSATFTVSGTVPAGTTGVLVNTATVAAPAGTTDQVPGNNSSSDTNPTGPIADLSITKTDGVAAAIPGQGVTYTIVVANNGPSDVAGATVLDTMPVGITGFNWTCSASAGSGCTASGSGNINDSVNVLSGGTVTYTVNATVSAAATGSLVNTATVAVPAGTTDQVPGNNSATDTDTLTPESDLSITKTDGVGAVNAGETTTYMIEVTNNGPSDVTGAMVTDAMPATLTGVAWTCSASAGSNCTASGSGNINDSVIVLNGGTVTYTVNAVVSPSATGSVVNTATVTVPGGTTDPVPGNDSATDTDTVNLTADLSITKTDGVVSVNAGGSTTYAIVVTNNGPSSVSGATVSDAMPAGITAFSWTCSASVGSVCTASGSGSINDSVSLLSGGTATYTVAATVSAAATGNLVNTATVAVPGGTTDPVPGNNSATDTDTVTLIITGADLSITKTDGVVTVDAGGNTTYAIVVTNNGPSDVTGAAVADIMPAGITAFNWTCTASAGSSCAASGIGSISDSVDLLSGGTATYTVAATISGSAAGPIINTATVTGPAGVTDPAPGNNSATDTDTIRQPDLTIAKTHSGNFSQGQLGAQYTVTVSNQAGSGPVSSTGTTVTVTDTLPAGLSPTAASGLNWACGIAVQTVTCTRTAANNALSAGASYPVITVTVDVAANAAALLTNTVSVSLAGQSESNIGNNSAADPTNIDQPNVFDPPSGFKTVSASGYPELVWRMVWINSGNAVALLTSVADDIDSNVSYVPASLQCEARGTSVTAVCVYDSAARRITWQGNIGPDPGASDEVQALNEVVITYRTTVAPNIARVENRGCANWDEDGNGSLDEITQGQNPVCTDDPGTPPSGDPTVWAIDPPVAIPTLDEWGMIIFMILAGVMALFSMRRRVAGSRR
ncbi:MAG: IPTL-CTERM sorting domain-containing protein [Thermodesulfovibrionales bacterium]